MRQTLSGLPDEVLSLLLESVFLDVLLLFMAGDSALNLRMVRSCRAIRSSPEMALRPLTKWPRLFAQLPALRVLNITVQRVHETLAMVATEIQKLPTQMVELSLQFEKAHMIPFHGSTNDVTHSPKLTHHLTSQNLSFDITGLRCWWTSSMFPSLKKAKFWSTTFFPTFVEFGDLPMHLESLSWSVRPVISAPRLLFGLPRTLSSLEFDPFNIDEPTAASLPPNLTHLRGALCNNFDVIAKLPSSLETGNWLSAVMGELTPSALSILPPQLKELKTYRSIASDFPIPWTQCLPRHLVKLLVLPTEPLIASFIAGLPRTLTSITNMALNLPEIHQSVFVENRYSLEEMWPPLLRTFSADAATKFHPKDLVLLPRTLTKLIRLTLHADEPVEPYLHTLPPPLIKFSARNASFGANWTLSMPMPLSLTLMDLTQTFTPEFSPSCFRFLPPQLVTLKLGECRIQTSENAVYVAELPRAIKHLELSSMHSDALSLLPPLLSTIATFSIHGSLNEEQAAILPTGLKLWRVSAYGYPHLSTSNPGPSWLQAILNIDIDDL